MGGRGGQRPPPTMTSTAARRAGRADRPGPGGRRAAVCGRRRGGPVGLRDRPRRLAARRPRGKAGAAAEMAGIQDPAAFAEVRLPARSALALVVHDPCCDARPRCCRLASATLQRGVAAHGHHVPVVGRGRCIMLQRAQKSLVCSVPGP